ncbi:MAG: hypothetical protein EOO10_23180 [Chitinophagaceae bacterium]|nr:MAG: hypothetical protein EOO10_23180 [Chitinophagaceae bacterium]
MNNSNRDLLVLFNQQLMTKQALEQEVSLLHEILFTVEHLDSLAIAHELIDLNTYRIRTKAFLIKAFIRSKEQEPFVFLCNKN